MTGLSLPEPTESTEQIQVFQWAEYARGKYPELELLYHVPNGGLRSKATAARLKCEGVKAGVPDICLPVAHGKYHGLYIELKRRDSGKLSAAQMRWLRALEVQGYFVRCCHGAREAIAEIEAYLKQGEPR